MTKKKLLEGISECITDQRIKVEDITSLIGEYSLKRQHIILKEKNSYIENVINSACEQMNITIEDIKSKTRKREVVIARYIAYKELYDNVGLNEYSISCIFGKERSAVSRGLSAINQDLETNFELSCNSYKGFKQRLNNA